MNLKEAQYYSMIKVKIKNNDANGIDYYMIPTKLIGEVIEVTFDGYNWVHKMPYIDRDYIVAEHNISAIYTKKTHPEEFI